MRLILFFTLISLTATAQNRVLKVQVSGFASNEGMLMLEVLDAQKKPVKQLVLPIKDRQVDVKIEDLGTGQYSVWVFHDANNNKKLDINLLGIPKESWGMSNNVRAVMGPPDFKESLFLLNADKTLEIVVR